ncbi:MAG: hypothetical protein CMF04_11350 [Hyphomonas sp.]|nr:hypothetical protein [Hyphomonas sp.]|tara:strand:+ start:8168 stop:8539 length:372 start_codon:yes stop_codon:yes gene_type:complete
MSDDKTNKDVLVNLALEGMMPLMIQKLRNSDQYGDIIKAIGEARVLAKETRQKARERIQEITTETLNRIEEVDDLIDAKLAELETLAADFMTEHGLSSVLEDIRAAEPAPAAEAFPVVQESAD